MPENLVPTIGSIYDVVITEAYDYDLVGKIIETEGHSAA